MEILKNSVWDITELDGLESGQYRVLHFFDDISCIILFPLREKKRILRPIAISLNTFKNGIQSKAVTEGKFSLPSYFLVSEDEIAVAHRVKRDENFGLIKSIIYNFDFLLEYATKKRMTFLTSHAEKTGKDRKTIVRLLNLYWRYGQDINSLLPAYPNSGAAGKERNAKGLPLGASKTPKTLVFERAKKYTLRPADKENIRKYLKRYNLVPKTNNNYKNLKECYEEMLRNEFSNEIKKAEINGYAPYVPSYKQFTTWKKKLFSPEEIIIKSSTERDFMLNKRGLLGSKDELSIVPGSYFEIDATVADVHIVSSFGNQYVLGRPTIYSIVDRATSMITGLSVSLYYASWRAAKQALANCFLSKERYCNEFGIDIVDSDWPCSHIPKTLVCDNGEMIGLQPQKLVVPLTELQLSPPYRPDFKGMVERRFGLLNSKVIHGLLGTTKGGRVVRGDKDPRKDAVYTLKEFSTLLIEAALELNRAQCDSLATANSVLIENNLAPTPLNLWKILLSKHKHALKRADENEVISRLFSTQKVSMTREGISYNGMFYSCDRILEENLASVARTNGQWQLDARVNDNTTNYLYVKFGRNEGFIKCHLLPKSKMFKNLPVVESDFVKDWVTNKKEQKPVNMTSIDIRKRQNSIEQEAKLRAEKGNLSFREKIKDTRNQRKKEIQQSQNATTVDFEVREEPHSKNVQEGSIVYLPRRSPKKGS